MHFHSLPVWRIVVFVFPVRSFKKTYYCLCRPIPFTSFWFFFTFLMPTDMNYQFFWQLHVEFSDISRNLKSLS